MRMRHVLLASAASIGLFLTATHLPDAYAQKGVFLKPSSQWAVTKVAGNPEAGQAGYCAVAKKYGANAILTIARNHGDETSFALDLQKSFFNVGQSLNVTLDPGAGEQRNYSISPASEQAFVVRLGRDEAFFNAIDRTGLLRVEAANESYVFNIADINAGQSKLNSCLLPSIESAEVDAPKAFPTQVETSSNKAFIDELNARIDSLESENVALQSKISNKDTEPVVGALLPVDFARVADVDVHSNISSEEQKELRAENLRLRAMLQTDSLEHQSHQLDVLQAENQRLLDQLDRQSNVSDEVAELQSRVDALFEENVSLKGQVSDAASNDLERESSFDAKIEQLRLENNALKGALADQVSSLDSVEGLKQQIKQVESENQALKERIVLDKQAAYEDRHNDMEALRVSYGEEIETLSLQIQDLKSEQRQNAIDNREIEDLKAKLVSLQTDNLMLKDDLQKKQGVNSAAQDNVASLEFENTKLQSAVQKSLRTHKLQGQAISTLESENAALKSKLSGLDVATASIDDLTRKLDEMRAALNTNEQKQKDQEYRLATLSGENESLRSALNERLKDGVALTKAMDDMKVLREEIAAKDAKLASFDGVPARLKKLLTAYRDTKENVHVLEQEMKKNAAQYEAAGKEKESIIAALRDDKSLLEEQDKINKSLMEKLQDEQTKNVEFGAKLEGLQNSVIAMAKLNEEIKGLHGVLAKKEQEIVALNTLRGELQQALASNERLKEEKQQLAYALEEALGMSAQKIAELEDNNTVLQQKHDNITAQNTAQHAEDLEMQKKITDELNHENVELRRTLASALNKLAEYKDNVTAVLAQNDVLRGQLDLASHLISSKEQEVPETSVQTSQPKAGVILASAETPAKPDNRPKTVKRSNDDVSFAERLAQIEPAAGEEDALEALVEEVTQSEEAAEEVTETVIESPDVVQEAEDFMNRDLNQAQIYEEQLKRSLDNQERIDASRADPIEVETLDNNLINDAIEDVAAQEEFKPLEDVAEQAREAESVADEAVEIRMSQDPFEGIEAQKDDAVSQSVQAAKVASEMDEDIPPLPQETKQPMSTPVRDASMSPATLNAEAISRVLRLANVENLTDVRSVDAKDNAYQWRAGNIFGSGEQRVMSSSAQFDGFVKDYLDRTEMRCPGDFAVVPENSKESGSIRVDSYEIACIGQGVSSSASLVFYNDGDVFTVLAHETEAENMSQAMATRDKIFTSLAEGRDS